MTRIQEILNKQVTVAEKLLQRAIAIPDGQKNARVVGFIRYDETITRPLQKEVEAWQTETTEFLRVLYGEDARQVADFERCINDKSHYFNFREGIQSEIQDCISKLRAYIKAETMKQQIVVNVSQRANFLVKKPLVFISHASKDEFFVEQFMNIILKEALGLRDENIICTSFERTGIEPGNSIPQYISANIACADVFLSMVSSNYKDSEVCMNEVGAAWALEKIPLQVVLPGTSFTQLGWLFNLDKAAKIDDGDSLDHLGEALCRGLGIGMPTPLHWNGPRNNFLSAITDVTHDPTTNNHTNNKRFEEAPHQIITTSTQGKRFQTGDIDDIINRAMLKLGEFTIKELQEETDIQNYRVVMDKVSAKVQSGALEAIGDRAHRKYRLKG